MARAVYAYIPAQTISYPLSSVFHHSANTCQSQVTLTISIPCQLQGAAVPAGSLVHLLGLITGLTASPQEPSLMILVPVVLFLLCKSKWVLWERSLPVFPLE